MASQSDKKEDFRKYLEKGRVLSVLTSVLTDLFEMDNKPEDPLQYLAQRFTASVNKNEAVNGPQKDAIMLDSARPTATPRDQPMPPIANASDMPAQSPAAEGTAPQATADVAPEAVPSVLATPGQAPASNPAPVVPEPANADAVLQTASHSTGAVAAVQPQSQPPQQPVSQPISAPAVNPSSNPVQ